VQLILTNIHDEYSETDKARMDFSAVFAQIEHNRFYSTATRLILLGK